MEELYSELNYVSGVRGSINLLKKQKEDFIKVWEGKNEVPFEALDLAECHPPLVVFIPKIKAIESIEEKIRHNERELEKHKLEAIKIMQRLIEEWT